jgi:hypothetical protein
MAQEIRESAKPKGCVVLWPANVVSEFILFEPIEKKPQKSITRYAKKLLIILKISVYILKLARYNITINEHMFDLK